PIFKHRVDAAKRQALIVQLAVKPPFPKPIQTAVGADPKISLAVFANRAHERVRQTVTRIIGIEKPVVPKQAVIRSDPDATAFVLANSTNGVVGQTVRHGERIHGAVRPQAIQTSARRDPKIPVPIFVNIPDDVRRQTLRPSISTELPSGKTAQP